MATAFLGTPHRGADLADVLKMLLNLSFSETGFVRDLSPNSQSIKEINDTFGERSDYLELALFWESTGMPCVGDRGTSRKAFRPYLHRWWYLNFPQLEDSGSRLTETILPSSILVGKGQQLSGRVKDS
jgi:hypothetical protein